MFESLFNQASFSITQFAIMAGASLILGVAIGLLYRHCRPESGKYNVVLALLPFLIASVILLVNGSIGTSVAVLGAFGLVRFRSAPGSAWEIGFLFYAMAVGLACGLGFVTLAAVIAVVAGVMFLILNKTPMGTVDPSRRHLRITIPEDLDYSNIFDDLFARYTNRTELEQIKTTNMGTMYELSYSLDMKDSSQAKQFIDEIRCRNGNLSVVLGIKDNTKPVL